MDAPLRLTDASWLQQLSARFTSSVSPERSDNGWILVDASHHACGILWLAVVHRDSMGRLQCPDCGGRDGYAKRVYANDEEAQLKRRWPDLEPFIHSADGSIEEGRCEA